MELVPLPCAVSHHNRMETDILEALQTQGAGHLGVEAAGAKLSVTLLNRAIVHDIVGRDGHTARLAADRGGALLTFVSHVISLDLTQDSAPKKPLAKAASPPKRGRCSKAAIASIRNCPGRSTEIAVDWSRTGVSQGVDDTARGHRHAGRRRSGFGRVSGACRRIAGAERRTGGACGGTRTPAWAEQRQQRQAPIQRRSEEEAGPCQQPS